MAPTFALSTASVYPESVAHGFAYAARLGYDAVEVMVSIDALSQDIEKVRRLRDYHEVPVCAVHSPCLLITQRVWGTDPWVKLEMSAEMAHELGADVVVVHPPFRWQREYAAGSSRGSRGSRSRPGIAFAVENMYPWRATSRRRWRSTSPAGTRASEDYANTTIDLSHAATAHSDPLEMAQRLGDRLRPHAPDRRLRLGQGRAPGPRPRHPAVRASCSSISPSGGFEGHIVLEINTRKAGTPRGARGRPARVAGVQPAPLRERSRASRNRRARRDHRRRGRLRSASSAVAPRCSDDLTFTVEPGEVTGLLGPSGCGKTTLMRAIVGVQQVPSGTVTVFGEPAGSAGCARGSATSPRRRACTTTSPSRRTSRFFAAVLGVDRDRVDACVHAST